jgi:hypothetical protein
MNSTVLSFTTARGDRALAETTRALERDLKRSGVSAQTIEQPAQPGEKGDVFSLGQLAIDLVTSGAVTALLGCLKAYLEKDKSLSFKLGLSLEINSHTIDKAETRAEVETALSKK